MKFRSLFVLLACLLASPAFAAYSISHVIDDFGTATTTYTTATSYSLTAGDRVEIVVVWYGDASNEPSGVTDTNSRCSSWTAISGATVINFNTDGISYAAYECKNVGTTGSTQITVTFIASAGHAGMAGVDVSGLSNTAAAQSAQQGQTNPGTTTNATTSGNVTPASQPAMLFGLSQSIAGIYATGVSAGTGFTSHTLTNFPAVNGTGAAVAEDLRLTSTSAVAATFTDSNGTADDIVTFGIVVPEASGGGGCNAACAARGFLGF